MSHDLEREIERLRSQLDRVESERDAAVDALESVRDESEQRISLLNHEQDRFITRVLEDHDRELRRVKEQSEQSTSTQVLREKLEEARAEIANLRSTLKLERAQSNDVRHKRQAIEVKMRHQREEMEKLRGELDVAKMILGYSMDQRVSEAPERNSGIRRGTPPRSLRRPTPDRRGESERPRAATADGGVLVTPSEAPDR